MVEACASVMVEACDGERYCEGGSLCFYERYRELRPSNRLSWHGAVQGICRILVGALWAIVSLLGQQERSGCLFCWRCGGLGSQTPTGGRIGKKLSRVCRGWRTAAAAANLSSIVRGNPPHRKTAWPDGTPGPRR